VKKTSSTLYVFKWRKKTDKKKVLIIYRFVIIFYLKIKELLVQKNSYYLQVTVGVFFFDPVKTHNFFLSKLANFFVSKHIFELIKTHKYSHKKTHFYSHQNNIPSSHQNQGWSFSVRFGFYIKKWTKPTLLILKF